MTRDHLFQFLGLYTVLSPSALLAALALPALVSRPVREQTVNRLIQFAVVTGLLASLSILGLMLATGTRHVPLELAQLSGPDGSEDEVAQRYLASQGRVAEAGMRITALRLDARGAWEFDLANGVTVRLGRRQIDERFQRFMSTAVKAAAPEW